MASEDNNWEYNPGPAGKSPRSEAVSWQASEYIDHKQGPAWFLALALATIALAAGVYLLSHDYFATTIIVVVGIIVGVFARRTPRELTYEISSKSLKIEDKNYPLEYFKSFSIHQDGPICSLELIPLKKFMPPISVFFEAADAQKIIAALENSLPFDQRPPDLTDRLSRRLRF